jgi:hypothetical protein
MQAVLRPAAGAFPGFVHLTDLSPVPGRHGSPNGKSSERQIRSSATMAPLQPPWLRSRRLNGACGRSIPYDRLNSVNEIFDVAVVGAGPAGSVAAYAAATRGLRVALIDRQAFPRDKPAVTA